MGMTPSNISLKYLSQAALVALLLVFSAQSADAQGAPSGEKASAYYNEGVEAFFKKEYSRAISYFQRANALDPNPVVAYNISLAHSKLGNAEEALSASLEARQMGGLPEDTALKNGARIRGYQRVLKAQEIVEAQTAAAQARAEAKQPAEEVQPPGAGGVGAGQPADSGVLDMGTLGWVGVGTAGAGVAALIGTGVMNFMVQSDLDDYDDARAAGDYERARGLQDDIESGQSIGQIMLYSGAGLVALGGALWAVDYFGGSEAQTSADASGRPTLSGAVGPGGASVQAGWRF